MIRRAVLNPVFSNLLMFGIITIGIFALIEMRRETFPTFVFNQIRVSVVYPGAGPLEVEESISIPIEDAVEGIEGIERVHSSSQHGLCMTVIDLRSDVEDLQTVLDQVRTEVDQIRFPDEAEKPVVTEGKFRFPVIQIALAGDLDEREMNDLGQRIRRELLRLPDVTQVSMAGAREPRIWIEIPETNLDEFGLTADEVIARIRQNSIQLPAGSIRGDKREVNIRVDSQRRTVREFEDVILFASAEGKEIRLGDVATVRRDFDDVEVRSRYRDPSRSDSGRSCLHLIVGKTSDDDLFTIAEQVQAYVAARNADLPEGVELEIWYDTSPIVAERLDVLYINMVQGLVVVFFFLWFLLGFRLAWWICLGLPVSFLGSIAILYLWGGTLNLSSTFAFILVLGMLVDDAIVIGENVFSYYEKGDHPLRAAYLGTREVAMPVLTSSLTTAAAFAPLFFMEGSMGKIMQVMPVIVCGALAVSFVESTVILPNHLGHSLPRRRSQARSGAVFQRVQGVVDRSFRMAVERVYTPILRAALRAKGLTIGVSIGLLFICLSLVQAGVVEFIVMPPMDGDYVVSIYELAPGSTIEENDAVARQVEAGLDRLRRDLGEEIVERVATTVGATTGVLYEIAPNKGEILVALRPSRDGRTMSSQEFLVRWREAVGDVAGVDRILFRAIGLDPGGKPIEIRLYGDDMATLRQASAETQERLRDYPGIVDVQDDYRVGMLELVLRLRPTAAQYGISARDLAEQLRFGFRGITAVSVLEGHEDMDVVVTLTEAERRSLGTLDAFKVKNAVGDSIVLHQIADIRMERSLVSIERIGGQRAITVGANVDLDKNNAERVVSDLEREFLPEMSERRGVRFSFAGQREQMDKSIKGLFYGMAAAICMIYAILCLMFRSWVQPLIIMATVPLSFLGAIVGHMLMGLDISVLSMSAFVGLAGVVVNDSLVLVEAINESLARGESFEDSVVNSSRARFRPIFLTSATTFLALLPMILETSPHAQVLVPMAVTIGFGILSETAFVLILIPAVIWAVNDVKRLWTWVRQGRMPGREEVEPAVLRARRLDDEEIGSPIEIELPEMAVPAPAPRPVEAPAERPATVVLPAAGDSIEAILADARRLEETDDQAAIDRYLAALRLDPSRTEAYLSIAGIRQRLGDLPGAAASLDRVIELSPDDADAIEYRAFVNIKAKEYGLAIPDLDRRLADEPDNLILLKSRAVAYLGLEKPSEALEDLDRAIEIGGLPDLYYLRGTAHLGLRDFQPAIDDFDELLFRRPDDVPGLLARGVCRLSLRRLDEALADLDEAHRLDPTRSEVHLQRGKVHLLSGRPQEALEDFSIYLTHRPLETYVLSLRGEAHVALGDHAAAVRDFQKFVRDHPNSRKRPALERYIRRH